MKKALLLSTAVAMAIAAPNSLRAETAMPETPADVQAAPADAQKTASGLASKGITKGTGRERPSAADTGTVHSSSWTTDGKRIDSSVKRGETTRCPLNGVIKGWPERVRPIRPGQKRRFWIPADLA